MSSAVEDDTNGNPYLALRAAKIKRNEQRLQELGLLNTSKAAISKAHTKQQRKSYTKKRSSPTVPLRRSERLSEQPQVAKYQEDSIGLYPQKPKRPRAVAPLSVNDAGGSQKDTVDLEPKLSPPPKPPAANSVRVISLSTNRLILGHGDTDSSTKQTGLLGRSMDQPGKEFVIYKSFEVAASIEDQKRLEGSRLSFNKYSGVQEWENCIFLWVNFGDKNNTVVNEFLNDTQQITWFGGSRMYEDTPVIEKLIRLGKEAMASSSRIIIWCRKFVSERRAYGPYVCLGRLSYHSHEPGSHPVAFVWNLLDRERLRSDEDSLKRFQSLVDSA